MAARPPFTVTSMQTSLDTQAAFRMQAPAIGRLLACAKVNAVEPTPKRPRADHRSAPKLPNHLPAASGSLPGIVRCHALPATTQSRERSALRGMTGANDRHEAFEDDDEKVSPPACVSHVLARRISLSTHPLFISSYTVSCVCDSLTRLSCLSASLSLFAVGGTGSTRSTPGSVSDVIDACSAGCSRGSSALHNGSSSRLKSASSVRRSSHMHLCTQAR
jgi:hypothetical protein